MTDTEILDWLEKNYAEVQFLGFENEIPRLRGESDRLGDPIYFVNLGTRIKVVDGIIWESRITGRGPSIRDAVQNALVVKEKSFALESLRIQQKE